MLRDSIDSIETQTTYRDFESREHLTQYVEERVESALGKFVHRPGTKVEVTLNSERAAKKKHFEVGITLKLAHEAPVHVMRKADDLHQAVRAAVRTIEKILERQHAKLVARRRHRDPSISGAAVNQPVALAR